MAVTLTVRAAALVNIGDFQNITVDYSLTDNAREGETVDQLKARLQAKVNKYIDEEVSEIRANHPKG